MQFYFVLSGNSDILSEPLKDIRCDQEQDAVKQEYSTPGHEKQHNIDDSQHKEYFSDRG
jgi:hypothetical protein